MTNKTYKPKDVKVLIGGIECVPYTLPVKTPTMVAQEYREKMLNTDVTIDVQLSHGVVAHIKASIVDVEFDY